MYFHRLLLLFLFLTIQAVCVAQFRFIENKNQWHEKAKFRAEIPNGFLFLEQAGFTYLFHDPASFPKHHGTHTEGEPASQPLRGHVVKVKLKDAKPNANLTASEQLGGAYNFLMGNNREKWGRNARAFGRVAYQQVYEGISMHFLQEETDLKYEFRVQPLANPKKIKLVYEGQEKIYLHNGELFIKTSVNAMKEERPYCYQNIDGGRVEVPSEFRLIGNELSFHFPEGYNNAYELVIDPRLVFSTFSGSTQDNWGFTATPDDEGHLYAGGMTRLSIGAFPTTPGAFQETAINTDQHTNIAITKYAPDGQSVVYATYLGGSQTDIPHSLIVNGKNELVILGTTSSADFPMNADSYDASFAGGSPRGAISGVTYFSGSDLFVAILSADGSDLVGASYWGGSANDGLNLRPSPLTKNYGDEFRGDIAIDSADNIFICSVTESADFPTLNAFQGTLGGRRDAVLGKFNADATNMIWSTYLGGNLDEAAYGLRLNESEQPVIVGGTASQNFPTTMGVLHDTYQGGAADGFISILSNDGQSMVASTLLGTSAYDQAYLIDIDLAGNIGVFGQTLGNYPLSANVYSTPFGGQFVHKLTPDLQQTVFSTVIGSLGNSQVEINIRPTAFLFDGCESLYLTGWGGIINGGYIPGSDTRNMPLTADAIQDTTDGNDFYMMALSEDASELLYASYFGNITDGAVGDHVDGGTSRFDKSGVIYQSVCSCGNSGFMTTPGVVSEVNAAAPRCNNAALKFDLGIVQAAVTPTEEIDGVFVPTNQGCAPLSLVFLNQDIQGQVFEWDFGDGTSLVKSVNTVTPKIYSDSGTYIVNLVVTDSATCKKRAFAIDTITVFPAYFDVTPDTAICLGDTLQLEATGGSLYNWSPALYLNDTALANPLSVPQDSVLYTVFMQNEFGCSQSREVSLRVIKPTANFDTLRLNPCDTFPEMQVKLLNPTQNQTYSWQFNNAILSPSDSANFTLAFDVAGTYELILTAQKEGCIQADTAILEIEFNNDTLYASNISLVPINQICLGDSLPLLVTGGANYLWQPASSLSDATSNEPFAFPSSNTVYQISISNRAGNCVIDTSLIVNILPNPQVTFSSDWVDAACGEIPSLKFTNNSTGAERFVWQFSNGDEFTTRDLPIYSPQDSGVLQVILTGTQNICQVSDTANIQVFQIGVPPNAFSPNGDGINDTFEVLNASDDGWQLKIFNRWGDLVFETDSYQNDWDGGNNTNGTFFYFLTSPDGNTCRGIVHVFR